MKKKLIAVFLIAMTSITISSCSKDESNDIPITMVNLSGKWYFKSVIKPGGTIEPFVHQCSSRRDYIETFQYGKISTFYNFPNCSDGHYERGDCQSYYIIEGNKIDNCSSLFDGAITKLTASELRIEYGETRNPGFDDNNLGVATGIILTRE